MMIPQEPVAEFGDCGERRFRRFPVRGVPHPRQQHDLDRTVALFLRHLDLQSSRRNADLLFATLRPLVDARHEDARLHTACFLICDLIGATARSAMGMDREEGERLVREFEALSRAYMLTFL